MCKIMEEVLNEGRAEGRAEGREEGRAEGREEGREEGRADTTLTVIRKLMEKSKMTVVQALDFLDVSDPVERERYQKMLAEG